MAIERTLFSKEHLGKVAGFYCGDSVSAEYAAEWIASTPPQRCGLKSMKDFGTNIWLYTESTAVVGFGSCGLNKVDGSPQAFIPMIAISDSFQGKKTADGTRYSRFILENILKECCELSTSRVYLFVHPTNTKAVHLYESYGFKAIGDPINHGNIRMYAESEALRDGLLSS